MQYWGYRQEYINGKLKWVVRLFDKKDTNSRSMPTSTFHLCRGLKHASDECSKRNREIAKAHRFVD